MSTTATGTATFQLNPAGTQITYTVTVTGLSGSASASHIHLAARGSTAGPNTNLCGGTGVPACATGTSGQLVTGTVAVPAATVTAIRNYGAYVNVHTSANPGGEIRGQLFPVVP